MEKAKHACGLAFGKLAANAKRKQLKAVALSIFFALLFGFSSFAQDSAPGDFILHAADGKNFSGPLRKLDPDGTIRLGGERPTLVPGPDVVSLRRAIPLPDYPKNNVVIL